MNLIITPELRENFIFLQNFSYSFEGPNRIQTFTKQSEGRKLTNIMLYGKYVTIITQQNILFSRYLLQFMFLNISW